MDFKKIIQYSFAVCILFVALFVGIGAKSQEGFNIVARKWYLNPDGQWILIVEAVNSDSRVRYTTSAGDLRELPVWAFNNLNAVKIITDSPMPLTITAVSERHGKKVLKVPPPNAQYANSLQATVTAVGPYLNAIGLSWLGTDTIQQYQIWRKEANSHKEKLIGFITAASISLQDDSVKPSKAYKYRIIAVKNGAPVKEVILSVTTPPTLPSKTLVALKEKGVILYIDPSDPASPYYFKKLTPDKIINDSLQLGFRYIQIRTVYGSYSHFNDKQLINWLSNLLDLGQKNNISILSWSIPRRDATNAIAEDIVVAGLKSPSGNGFSGSSLDLETGSDYMGKLPEARSEIIKYTNTFRKAVGPDYLISSIVFTPWRTGYTNENYPYEELAKISDVMQPMVFWHHFYTSAHHVYSTAEVAQDIVGSIMMTKQMSGRDIPINVIGQSIDLGNTGMPTKTEIITAMQAANTALAIGVSFFAWNDALIPADALSETAEGIMNFQW